jgi:hypothetical protein
MKEQTTRKDAVHSTGIPKKNKRITSDDIRFRAYEIYLERGSEPGRDLDDWLKAEMELIKPVKG